MTNHPVRTPSHGQQRMTPGELRDLRARAGLTQTRAAELAGVALRTMQQYEAGDRKMPRSASGLLCMSCIVLGAPAGLFAAWLPGEIWAVLACKNVVVTKPHKGWKL